MTNEEILAQPNHLERRALMALNILREAAGLEPLSDEDDPWTSISWTSLPTKVSVPSR